MPITNAPPLIGGNKKTTPVKKSTSKNDDRREALEGLGQLAQVPLIATKQFADAGAIGIYWPNVSKELANLADSQDAIAKVIDPLLKVGPYTGLVTALLPFLMQIAVNHGRVAPGAMGTVPASMLSAQIETRLANAELEALRMQREAEKAAAEMRAEIELNRAAMTVENHDSPVNGE